MATVHVRISQTVEEPAQVRMKEAIQRAMRIALPVSLRVMLDMRGSPINCGSLCRHAAKDEKDRLYNRMGPETAMGQHAMVANSHARHGDGIHCHQERQIGPMHGLLPEQAYCQKSTKQRQSYNDEDIESNNRSVINRLVCRNGFHTTSM